MLSVSSVNLVNLFSDICAYPESINVISHIKGDTRTPDKLIDGVTNDNLGRHSWLAPIIPKHLNRLYVVMDRPVAVSSVIIWNYSKTPNRGVKDFGVYVYNRWDFTTLCFLMISFQILIDDLLIFTGTLNISNKKNKQQEFKIFGSDLECEKS